MDELLGLRDAAQLSKTANDNDNEEAKQEKINNQKFIDMITQIHIIYNQLRKISISGYPDIIKIKIDIKDYNSSFYWGEETSSKTAEKIISSLKEELSELKKKQKKAYEERPLIRFLYGRQFNLIKSMDKKKLFPFLMFLTGNLMTKHIQECKFINSIDGLIDGCQNYLKEILKKNNIDLDSIYKNSLINKDYTYKGLYLHYIDKRENLEKDLFLVYRYLTKYMPISQNILLCTKDTTSEELTAFLYRAILCEFNACFIIGGIESLEFDKKAKILELLNSLLSKHEKMESCLIILYTNNNSDIYKSINLLKYGQNLQINTRDYSQIKIDKRESNVDIITSDKSGSGKSTKIKTDIIDAGKTYIYFPFGGVINRKDIFTRLQKLDLSNPEKCTIHLDLSDTDQIDLMTEFLFSLLITKIYGHDEDLFYFPKEIEIKIEIPNGFVNLINKFPILTLFDKTASLIRDLPPLIVDKDITSNVQIVANFLKLLKEEKMDKVDLYFEGITPIYFSGYNTLREVKSLSQKECQDLIFGEIKKHIDLPNYYQISAFIDVLATQFKDFNRNYFVTASLLSRYGNLRTFIIESYIRLTKHFTKGAFAGLEETKEEITLEQNNEEKEVENGIKKLSEVKTNLISFDKFNYSLIFFHEGVGQGFSIISNLPSVRNVAKDKDNFPNKTDYDKLYNLFNSQRDIAKQEREDLVDYKQFNQEQFLNELKTILNLQNQIHQFEKEEEIVTKKRQLENTKIQNNLEITRNNEEINKNTEEFRLTEQNEEKEKIKKELEKLEEEKKEFEKEIKEEIEDDIKKIETLEKRPTIEEIVGKYVFTADNFIKMILILIRIRANIPVIMMGETGCGKTSLIRMLSRLLNDGSNKKMKILNIHSGITDNDIIDFIEKEILEDAKKYQVEDDENAKKAKEKGLIYIPKKLWVFLDEINTCKSMGLISELMCKRSYQGKPLPPNVVFIAACNPYRYYQGVKINTGLDVNNAIKEKKNLDQRQLDKLKRNANNNLVYTVNPLPHSLLHYVFDFGNLEKNDEKKYIESMVEEPIKRINKDLLNEKEIKKIHKIVTIMILTAQNFTRDKNEISSVSLREIRRYNVFYEFFFDYLRQRQEEYDNNKKNNIIN